VPEPGPRSAPEPPLRPPAPSAPERRSLQLALVAVVAGVMLATTGAGRAWVRITAVVELPGLGSARLGARGFTANDLFPLGGFALLGLVLLVGVAVTRGRGRWAVGLALLALGVALVVAGALGRHTVEQEAFERANRGLLEGVPTGGGFQVASSPAGPVLVVVGGLLLGGAGVEAIRRGQRWPALGDAFRAPPDRREPVADTGEPPWEGD
jgi:tryptophan-associated transmembrane protein